MSRLKRTLLLIVGLGACSDAVTAPEPDAVSVPASAVANVHLTDNGATVLNRGAKDRSAYYCFRGSLITRDLVINRRPSGGALLSCQWKDLPPIAATVVDKGFSCVLNFDGHTQHTISTRYTRTPSGLASMSCRFDKD
jgi:hypothetical protein